MNVVAILGVAGILSRLVPILVKDYLEAGPAALGTLWSIMALGTVLGAAASTRLSAGQREKGMLLSWLVYGLLFGALVLPTRFVVILAILVQERMRGDQVSKTFAGFSTLANTGEAISAPVLGLVTAAFGLGAGFALGALFPVVAAMVGLVYLSRRRPSDPSKSPA